MKASPRDSGLHYDAACAYALASRALSRRRIRRRVRNRPRERSRLLKEAIRIGYSDYDHIQEDADLDPIRGLPAFAEIMNAGRPIAAMRRSGATMTASSPCRFSAWIPLPTWRSAGS